MGVVPEIAHAYERVWLALCPLRFGTGLKRKCIEALGQGKTMVLTAVGKAFLRGDSAAEFARHCIQILTSPETRRRLEQGAYEYASAWNRRQFDAQRGVMAAAGLLPRGPLEVVIGVPAAGR